MNVLLQKWWVLKCSELLISDEASYRSYNNEEWGLIELRDWYMSRARKHNIIKLTHI